MRFRLTPLRAVSTFAIFGTALATVLTTAPAQASLSVANTGHSITMHSNATPRGVGAITGIVDGAGGQPLTAACVVASGQGRSVLAVTTSDGRYTLNRLPVGSYTLRYSACAAGGHYADQWWGGAQSPNSAAKVSIHAGQERELATVTLRSAVPAGPAVPPAIARLKSANAGPGPIPNVIAVSASGQASGRRGAIAGTVTGAGKPLSGVCVFAGGGGHTVTSKSGKYRIAKVKPGRYAVEFIPFGFCGTNTGDWLRQFYKNINGPIFHGKLTRVVVKAGKTTSGIDASLNLGGEITGTVKSQAGKALSRVCVATEGRQGRAFLDGFTSSNKHGGYVLHSLFPGKYTVVFEPRGCGNTDNVVAQWWKNSATQKHATKITVTSGQAVRGINGSLHAGAVISGVVRGGSSHGALLKGICVFAQPRSGDFYEFSRVITNSKGAYRLTGLTTGKYQLFYLRNCGNKGNFLEVRRTISVVTGQVTAGVDTVLPVGAIIRGKVTDTHGHPISGICVSVNGHGFGAAKTAADGSYSVIALPTGSYKVSFAGGCHSTGSFAPQYYRGQVNAGSADPVTATAGHVTGNISAVMQPGGTITGVVTDSSGTRLSRVCVDVETRSVAQSGFPFGMILQTKDGVYTAANLVPGDYAVNFGCVFGAQTFASQWFRGQAAQGSSDFVSAPAGRVTSGVSAVMRSGGSISGTVTSSAGPLGGMCVEVFAHGQPPAQVRFYNHTIAFTNRHGAYQLSHLAAAKYDVEFGCGESRFASQWYRGTSSRVSSTPVTVVNKKATTGINAVMTAGGTISGTVTTGANHPQSRICVSASDSQDVFFGEGFTNAQGQYTIKNLNTGSYQVAFFDCGGGKGHVRLGTASLPQPVHLVAPHAVTAATEKMSPAGAISGTVLGGPSATPQSDVCVVAVPKGGTAVAGSAATNSTGTYRISDLAPGTYKVYLGDPSCGFSSNSLAPQWYQGKSSEATATGVKVVSNSDTAGIGATLGGDGTITGAVTTQAHKPVSGECVTAAPVNPVPEPLFNAVPNPVVAISSGSYVLTGLVPGKYTVEFSTGCGATGFRTQWWHNAGSAGKATVITVPASTTINGINATVH